MHHFNICKYSGTDELFQHGVTVLDILSGECVLLVTQMYKRST